MERTRSRQELKFVTINNCEGCTKAPCHKEWTGEFATNAARETMRENFTCLSEDMTYEHTMEVAHLSREVGLPFVIEVKQGPKDQCASFDFWVPNHFLNTEPFYIVRLLLAGHNVISAFEREQAPEYWPW